MDRFGVLVESIGFKSQTKSVPLADLKNRSSLTNDGFPSDIGISSSFSGQQSSLNLFNESFVDGLDGIFRSNYDRKATASSAVKNDFDDVFGGTGIKLSKNEGDTGSTFDFDSMFKGSNSSVSNNFDLRIDDDMFGGMPELKSTGSGNYDNFFGGTERNQWIDGGIGLKPNGLTRNSGAKKESVVESDDLIPGFRASSPSNVRATSDTNTSWQSSGNPSKPFSTLAEDPFGMFVGAQGTAGDNGASGIDDYLDSLFGQGNQSSTSPSHESTTQDVVYDKLFPNSKSPVVKQTPQSSHNAQKASSATVDFSFLFGMEASPSYGEFQEIEGESEERRRARLNHHTRTQERMAKVLNEKNQRDLQTQREQEERHRIAETLDADIKSWAAGKEGNLRALLSSLQLVLWPEWGWQPVSLTDLITPVSVKKVYYKATLCVHPDKVQQKGANLQQKYVAEKVFDLLKEAWNKFNKEEL